MKKVLKALGIVLLALVLAAGGYFAYVMIDYHRIEDNLVLECDNTSKGVTNVPVGDELKIVSYNIGFGAYLQDYSFFMDGGEYSRAYSKESVIDNISTIGDFFLDEKADFFFVQEVDKDSTRAYHVDETKLLKSKLNEYGSAYAINYDSPYLLYPLTSPHGKSLSGILTFSKYGIESSLRRSLPIQTDLTKLIDLDRCYSISRVPTSNGKTLCLFNFHLSAYTTDPTIVNDQLEMLYEDIKAEYAKGNYIICGGDFNKDLLGNSPEIFGVSGDEYSWAKPYPFETIPDHFKVVAPHDPKNPVATCRNTDTGYVPGKTFEITLDGFLVSDNVKVEKANVINHEYAYTDHNPVFMNFVLEK